MTSWDVTTTRTGSPTGSTASGPSGDTPETETSADGYVNVQPQRNASTRTSTVGFGECASTTDRTASVPPNSPRTISTGIAVQTNSIRRLPWVCSGSGSPGLPRWRTIAHVASPNTTIAMTTAMAIAMP